MKKLLALLFVSIATIANAQKTSYWKRPLPDSRKGQMYISWGYNRAFFGRSDIHLHGDNYDFTVYQVTAHDRPSKFNFNDYFNPGRLTIPQFNFRAGYCLSDKWAISFGTDHMKYVMDKNQYARISGVISPEASEAWAGAYLNAPEQITTDLLTFEHTDGLNLVSFDVERNFILYKTRNNRFAVRFNTAIGGLFVVPRSDVRVFNVGDNCNYHIAGYCMNARAGFRFEFLRNLFFEVNTRAGYMTLPSIFVKIGSQNLAEQNIRFIEYYASFGGFIPLAKRKK